MNQVQANNSTISPTLKFAEWFHEHIGKGLGKGFFPCKPSHKVPATKHGFKDATFDANKLTAWFARGSNNIALATGNGLVVIDIDVKKGDGLAEFNKLQEELGDLPDSYSVKTPSGGLHRYFRYSGVRLGNTQGGEGSGLSPNIDTRAEDGYVVVPPSYVVDAMMGIDGAYTVQEPAKGIAKLPEAWLDRLLSLKSRATTQPSNVVSILKLLPDGWMVNQPGTKEWTVVATKWSRDTLDEIEDYL